jgi:hypothetical protein
MAWRLVQTGTGSLIIVGTDFFRSSPGGGTMNAMQGRPIDPDDEDDEQDTDEEIAIQDEFEEDEEEWEDEEENGYVDSARRRPREEWE